VEANLRGFFYCCFICTVVKRERERKGCVCSWDTIYRFNPATFLCLSKARTWIFKAISGGLFVFNGLRLVLIVRFVDIGGIVDHHCLNSFSK
jgi:hypothetical protein